MKKIFTKYKERDLLVFCVWFLGQITKTFSVFYYTSLTRLLFFFSRVSCGNNLKIDGRTLFRFLRSHQIFIGDNCTINSRFNSNLVGGTNHSIIQCLGVGTIHIGNNAGLSFVIISSRNKIIIGNNVKIGGNVRIFDHNFHSIEFLNRRNPKLDQKNIRSSPVTIGDDVFIGTNAIILKGTTIGDRSIIGAGSVVSGKIPPDEIWAGNPAKFIRKLGEKNV